MATAMTASPEPEITPPSDDVLYEVVNGQIVEKPMGTSEAEIASILAGFLAPFARMHQLGKVITEIMFLIDPAANLQRRPDLAFVSNDRWPYRRRVPKGAAWNMVPDLAVEVVSPTNTCNDLMDKIEDYFRVGVPLVWVIFPNHEKVYVYQSPTSVRILQVGDDLDGGAVVPGFRLQVSTLFEDEPDAPPAP